MNRDAARFGRWTWLFPATYLLHIAEEDWGGFPAWLSAAAGASLSRQDFLIINAIAFAVMTTIVIAAQRGLGAWTIAALGTVVSINAALHIGGSVLTGSYSPGVVTATLLWLPLGLYTLRRLRHDLDTGELAAGILTGVLLHVLVSAAALAG